MRILTIFRNMAAIVLILAAGQKATAQVEVHALPEKDAPYTSPLYEVSVRSVEESAWHPVTVLRCDVNTRRVQHAAYGENPQMRQPEHLRRGGSPRLPQNRLPTDRQPHRGIATRTSGIPERGIQRRP